VLGKNWQYLTKRLVASMLAASLAIALLSCSSQPNAKSSFRRPGIGGSKMAEVAPPPVIQELRRELDIYQPQVKILSPHDDEVLQDTKVSVRVQVQDLPTFQDKALELGPHLHLILDNQPYGTVYDPKQPIVFDNLEPGTHTIRVFAASPWDESFKNEGAYAQTTFHLFAKTPENKPDLSKPLLTYSRPKGSYGAEPILLDFYISNVPLHLVAQEDADDDIPDWRIRCTINGESFIFDRWEPIYLKGLKSGKNWIQMELLDDQGNPFPNAFNNTVRLIDYQPGGQDTLSKLTRGEISGAIARSIIDPNYKPPAPEPEPIEKVQEPTPTLEPPAKPLTPLPVKIQEPSSKPSIPQKTEEPKTKEKAEEKPDAEPAEEKIKVSPSPVEKVRPVPVQSPKVRPIPVQPTRVQKPIEPPVIEPPEKEVPLPVEPVLTAPKLQIKAQPIAPPAKPAKRPIVKPKEAVTPRETATPRAIAPQKPAASPRPIVIKEPVEPAASPAPRSSEDVRQRAKEKVDAATEKLDDTFDALRERSGKVREETQNFFKRFGKTSEPSEEQKRAKSLLNRFQQPVGKMNDFPAEPSELLQDSADSLTPN
jgi:hypothetical protein